MNTGQVVTWSCGDLTDLHESGLFIGAVRDYSQTACTPSQSALRAASSPKGRAKTAI
ncbi:MAG: hypothetical protein IJO88_01395 [Oscillospiraceae bacterium]|nr:hypothetical protein [Oscillospiraceae bacterium]